MTEEQFERLIRAIDGIAGELESLGEDIRDHTAVIREMTDCHPDYDDIRTLRVRDIGR